MRWLRSDWGPGQCFGGHTGRTGCGAAGAGACCGVPNARLLPRLALACALAAVLTASEPIWVLPPPITPPTTAIDHRRRQLLDYARCEFLLVGAREEMPPGVGQQLEEVRQGWCRVCTVLQMVDRVGKGIAGAGRAERCAACKGQLS